MAEILQLPRKHKNTTALSPPAALTIIDVMRSLDMKVTGKRAKRLSWKVGSAMRKQYQDEFGRLPPKELRRKTSGGGSHCFAVYPPNWKSRIKRTIFKMKPVVLAEFILAKRRAA